VKLWSYWRSSCAYRVRITLALKGLPFDYAAVHLMRDGGEQYLPEYGAVNPLRQVPALEVDEASVTLVQSMAIIEYLDERYPKPPLLPHSALERAHVRALAELVNSGIQPHQNTSVFAELKRHGVDHEAWARLFISRGLEALERLAAPRAGAFMFGDSVSLADVYLVPQLYNARRFQLPLDAYPTLTRADESAQALPGFQSAAPEAQPDADAI
jgi:maleylpyruvate isomerase